MPRYTYLQFTQNSDDMNVPGSNDPTKPSEGWKGRDVNDAVRATNSALRNLGDAAAKLPLDGNGNPIPTNLGRIGTAAFQNTDTFTMEGGFLGDGVRGSVGFGVILPFVCPFADLGFNYDIMRRRGFDLCDGRTTTNPYPPGNSKIMPNYRGLFLWMAENDSQISSEVFSDFNIPVGSDPTPRRQGNRFIQVSDHNHGDDPNSTDGITGPTSLGYSQLPPVVTSISSQTIGPPTKPPLGFANGNDRGLDSVVQGNSGTHAHTIPSGGNHSFTINIRPSALAVMYFLRVW